MRTRAFAEPMGAQESWLGGDPVMARGPGGGGGRIVMGGKFGWIWEKPRA